MNFCSQCGKPVEQRIPAGDSRPRHICNHCGTIHYQNPKIVAGTLPVFEGRILLCKRAIEPRLGYWTLPAGFMENQESTAEAALRETWEEAQAVVEIINLYTVIDVPQISQVHIFFLANLPKPEFSAGEESLEVELFAFDDIPWNEIAFPTVTETLKHFLHDHNQQQGFPVHVKEIRRQTRKT
ncbi:MAG: NUDIX hydrolase [Hahellaceae bacterium]|nr:NUDIX hydrolase [Hahellaceae bacterium]